MTDNNTLDLETTVKTKDDIAQEITEALANADMDDLLAMYAILTGDEPVESNALEAEFLDQDELSQWWAQLEIEERAELFMTCDVHGKPYSYILDGQMADDYFENPKSAMRHAYMELANQDV